jgi:hypothetical protein
MNRVILLLAVATTACNREAPDTTTAPQPAAPGVALPGEATVRQSAKVIPKPTDQAQLDRLILAGYTPHADHLHPPGVKSCPLAGGSEAVM